MDSIKATVGCGSLSFQAKRTIPRFRHFRERPADFTSVKVIVIPPSSTSGALLVLPVVVEVVVMEFLELFATAIASSSAYRWRLDHWHCSCLKMNESESTTFKI